MEKINLGVCQWIKETREGREEGRKDANLVFLAGSSQTQPVGQESDAEISLLLSILMLSSGQYRDEPRICFSGEKSRALEIGELRGGILLLLLLL